MESKRARASLGQQSIVKPSPMSEQKTTTNPLGVELFSLLAQGELINKEKTLLACINQLNQDRTLDHHVRHFFYACTYSLLAKETYYDTRHQQCAALCVTDEFLPSIPLYLDKADDHLLKIKGDVHEILNAYRVDRDNLAILFNIGSLFPDILISYIKNRGATLREHEASVLIECFQRHNVGCKDVIIALIANECHLQEVFNSVNRKPILFLADFLISVTARADLLQQIDINLLAISIELHLGKIENEAKNGNISRHSRQFLNTLLNVTDALNQANFFADQSWEKMKSVTAFTSLIENLLGTQPTQALKRSSSLLFPQQGQQARPPCSKTSFIRDLSNYLYSPNTTWKAKALGFISYTKMPPEIKEIKKILQPTRHKHDFLLPSQALCDDIFAAVRPLFEEFSRPYTGRDDRHPMVDKFFDDFKRIINQIEGRKNSPR